MKWSPAIAGKRGRCKCGATVQVPDEIDPPAEEDPLSALDIPLQEVAEPTQYANRAAVPALPSARPLAYATPAPRAASSVASGELLRDIYLPGGVLVLGFGLLLGWLASQGHFFFAAIVTMVILAGLLMVAKTVALSLFAWYLAKKSGGSFGNPLSTILKIAGLVVSLDAATLWILTFMVMIGAITHNGEFYPIHTLLILFLVTFVVALLVAHLAYRLDEDEAKLFSRFMAGGNLVINVLLVIILAMMARSAATGTPALAAAQTGSALRFTAPSPPAAQTSSAAAASSSLPAAQTSSAPGPAVAPPPAPSVVVETDRDSFIWNRSHGDEPYLRTVKQWKTSTAFNDKDVPVSKLLDRLAVLGTIRTVIDVSGAQYGMTHVYVELPVTAQPRDACFAAVNEFQPNNPQVKIEPELPTTARYLEITLHDR